MRIVAPLDFRVAQAVQQGGTDEKEAHRVFVETDHNKDAHIRRHFHETAADLHVYDQVPNFGNLGLEDTAGVLVNASGDQIQ